MIPALVVDASVAVKWFVAEEHSDVAERLLDRTRILHAPHLLKTELGNALWKNYRRKLIGREQAFTALDRIGRTITRWHDVDGLLGSALDWSLRRDHPIYDFCYLALANTLGLRLVTADPHLIHKLAGTSEAALAASLSEFA